MTDYERINNGLVIFDVCILLRVYLSDIKGVQKFSFILDVSFIFEEINAEISIFKIIPLEIGSHDNVLLFSPKTVHVSFKS